MKLKHYEAGEKLKPAPWLVPDAVKFLDLILDGIRRTHRDPVILETGCGGSTLFFAEHGCEITSFEHNKVWFRIIDDKLEEYDRTFIDLRFEPDYPKRGLARLRGEYDLALIDGRGRVKSITTAIQSVKNGGFLILDNSERPRYKVAVKMLNQTFKERIVFKKDWTTTFWKIHN